MELNGRNLVLAVGDSAFDSAPFAERSLTILRVTVKTAPDHFNEARAIVVADCPNKFGLIKDCYANLFPQAEDYGLAPVVMVHSQPDLFQVAALKQTTYSTSCSKIYSIKDIPRAAEFIARLPVVPPAGNIIFEPTSMNVTDDVRLLLRRAFWDCDRIHLEPLVGGKLSIGVFRAHAWLKQSEVGPCPFSFFVKIDTRERIEEEKSKYSEYAEHYIPYYLRPNLDNDRCVATRDRAALVGDFVDDAIPLRKALRSGNGVGALFSLFETSLRGFRLQPFAARAQPVAQVLKRFAEGRIRADELPSATVQLAQNFGLELDVATLQRMICDAASRVKCLEAPCHGDLHAGNVMVRGGDAILIDFSSVGKGPLTADPACLEVSLLFGTDEHDKPGSFLEWQRFIDDVYMSSNADLHPSSLFVVEPGPYAWLRRSLRELRHILLGCDVQLKEAKILLAAYLLRFGRLGLEEVPADLEELASRRHAYALIVAERIVKALEVGDTAEGNA